MNMGLFVSRFGDYLQFTGFVTWVVIFVAVTIYAVRGVRWLKARLGRP